MFLNNDKFWNQSWNHNLLRINWPPDVKNWLLRKDPDPEKDLRQEKRTTEDEMVGWHHRPDGHEFEQALGDGQGSLACCSPWVAKSHTWLSDSTDTITSWISDEATPSVLDFCTLRELTGRLFRVGVCGLRELSVWKSSVTSWQLKTSQFGLFPFFCFLSWLTKTENFDVK